MQVVEKEPVSDALYSGWRRERCSTTCDWQVLRPEDEAIIHFEFVTAGRQGFVSESTRILISFLFLLFFLSLDRSSFLFFQNYCLANWT